MYKKHIYQYQLQNIYFCKIYALSLSVSLSLLLNVDRREKKPISRFFNFVPIKEIASQRFQTESILVED